MRVSGNSRNGEMKERQGFATVNPFLEIISDYHFEMFVTVPEKLRNGVTNKVPVSIRSIRS